MENITEKEMLSLIGYIDDDVFNYLKSKSIKGFINEIPLLFYLHQENHIKEYLNIYGDDNLDMCHFVSNSFYWDKNLTLERIKNIYDYFLKDEENLHIFCEYFLSKPGAFKYNSEVVQFVFEIIKKENLKEDILFKDMPFYFYMKHFDNIAKYNLNNDKILTVLSMDSTNLRLSEYDFFESYVKNYQKYYNDIDDKIVYLAEKGIIDLDCYIDLFVKKIIDNQIFLKKDSQEVPLLFYMIRSSVSTNKYIVDNIDDFIDAIHEGKNILTAQSGLIECTLDRLPVKYMNKKDPSGKNLFILLLENNIYSDSLSEKIKKAINKGVDLLDNTYTVVGEKVTNMEALTIKSPIVTMSLIKDKSILLNKEIKKEIYKGLDFLENEPNLVNNLLKMFMIKIEKEEILNHIGDDENTNQIINKKRI